MHHHHVHDLERPFSVNMECHFIAITWFDIFSFLTVFLRWWCCCVFSGMTRWGGNVALRSTGMNKHQFSRWFCSKISFQFKIKIDWSNTPAIFTLAIKKFWIYGKYRENDNDRVRMVWRNFYATVKYYHITVAVLLWKNKNLESLEKYSVKSIYSIYDSIE